MTVAEAQAGRPRRAPRRLPRVPDARGSACLRERALGTAPRAGARTCVYPDVPRQLAGLLEGLPAVRAGIREPAPVHVAVVGPRAGHPSATRCLLSPWRHPSRGPLHTGRWPATRACSSARPPPQGVRVSPTHTHTHGEVLCMRYHKNPLFPYLSKRLTQSVSCFRGRWARPLPRRRTRRPLPLRGHAAVSRAMPAHPHTRREAAGLCGPTPAHQPGPDSAPALLASAWRLKPSMWQEQNSAFSPPALSRQETVTPSLQVSSRGVGGLSPPHADLKSTSKSGRVAPNASQDARLASPASSSH